MWYFLKAFYQAVAVFDKIGCIFIHITNCLLKSHSHCSNPRHIFCSGSFASFLPAAFDKVYKAYSLFNIKKTLEDTIITGAITHVIHTVKET